MKNKFYLLAFLLLPCMALAQETEPKQDLPFLRNQFSINLAVLKSSVITNGGSWSNMPFCPSLGVHYGINDWLEAGASATLRIMDLTSEKPTFFQCYAAEAKAHLLSAIIKPSFYIVDVYATAQIGLAHYPIGNIEGLHSVTKFCWGVNAGLAINPSRHFGIFGEYGYNSADYFKSYWRFGLNVRFGGPKKWQNSKP